MAASSVQIRPMILTASVATLVYALFFFSQASVWGDSRPRLVVGQVLGDAVYRFDLESAEPQALYRIFVVPVWQKYLSDNADELRVSPEELDALTAEFTKAFNADQRPALEAELAEVNRRLRERAVDADRAQRRKLERRRESLQRMLRPEMQRELAAFWLKQWKPQRLIYEKYGGGRLVFQQAGVEAFDAMQAWARDQERQGRFEIYDEKLRRSLYSFWDPRKHRFLGEESERMWLSPEGVRIPGDPDSKHSDGSAAEPDR